MGASWHVNCGCYSSRLLPCSSLLGRRVDIAKTVLVHAPTDFFVAASLVDFAISLSPSPFVGLQPEKSAEGRRMEGTGERDIPPSSP